MVHKFLDRADEQRKEAEVVRLRTPPGLVPLPHNPAIASTQSGSNFPRRCIMTIYIDLNDYSGGPHWLSAMGKVDREAIRAKYRNEAHCGAQGRPA